jgi:hypothetical protein
LPDRRAVAAGLLVVLLAAGLGGYQLLASRSKTPTVAGPAPRFTDETAASGLVHTYDGGFPFAVGGGLAVLDCNDDRRPDLYLAGGENDAELFRNDSPVGGSLRFTTLHDKATDLAAVNGAYPIDVDGDGHVDLVILRNGVGNVLLRGLGDCRFEDATAAWGLQAGQRHTEAFSAMWEPGSKWPTMAFGNYVDPNVKDPAAWCEPNQLIRPAAAGLPFRQPLDLRPSWCTLSLLFSDWDGSGRMDLRASNDRDYYPVQLGEEQLWRIGPNEQPRLYSADDGWVATRVQGMGIASYDLTGDGLPEVYLTSEDASKLQTLAAGPANPRFRDIGLARGVNVEQPFTGPDIHLPSTAWHPEFDDVNNDGFVDLFVSKGNVRGQIDHAMSDPSNLLLGQPDGTFHEAADQAGIVTFDKGRGAALVDFNLDGRLDLVLAKYGAPVQVWRNDASLCAGPCEQAAHWLAIQATQPGPNVDAIGGEIAVRVGDAIARRELTIGGGHGSGQLGWTHVGLGPSDTAEVQVRWPDGSITPWRRVDADSFVIVDHATDTMVRWQPSAMP